MLEVIRRYREMRPASVLVIIVALIFGGYNVHRALGVGAHVDHVQVAAASPLASKNASQAWFGDPVFTKAERSTLKSVETLTRIEELQVGERIRSDAPTDELDLQFGTEIIPEFWRKLTLVAPKRDGSSADVVLLRPTTWLTEQQAEVGRTVFISVPECGIDGHASVLSIEPCPPIEPAGDLGGRVITGTFRHLVSASISLSITGQAEPILCTGNHPFWSEVRQDFVRADSLEPHETLRTTTGTTTVTSLSHIPGSTPVYNLEIHGTHVYHVGTSGVLVHNGNDLCEKLLKEGGLVRREIKNFQKLESLTDKWRYLREKGWTDTQIRNFFRDTAVRDLAEMGTVLQRSEHTLLESTAKALNERYGKDLTSREWGRALEALKDPRNNLGLGNDHHGIIDELGNYFDLDGNFIDSILDYL